MAGRAKLPGPWSVTVALEDALGPFHLWPWCLLLTSARKWLLSQAGKGWAPSPLWALGVPTGCLRPLSATLRRLHAALSCALHCCHTQAEIPGPSPSPEEFPQDLTALAQRHIGAPETTALTNLKMPRLC